MDRWVRETVLPEQRFNGLAQLDTGDDRPHDAEEEAAVALGHRELQQRDLEVLLSQGISNNEWFSLSGSPT